MSSAPGTGVGVPAGRRQLPVHQDDLCVARVPLFQGLTRAEQEQVATVARPTRLGRDEIVYTAGQDVSQLMVVHTGRVKISRVTADGIFEAAQMGDADVHYLYMREFWVQTHFVGRLQLQPIPRVE